MIGRRFYKTKLCKLYQAGRCPRATCSFAHGAAELRRSPIPGRRDYRSGDLRDKLDRRHSPHRRYSPERDARGHHAFHSQKPASRDRGRSLSRSPARRSEGRHRKRQSLDGQSDVSESYKTTSGAEDHRKEDRVLSYDEKVELEEELKRIQWDFQKLEDDKLKLETIMEEKNDEANKLSNRIKDLEVQLNKEQEDCKRIASKIKKFTKAHGRYLKAQEELKRQLIDLKLDRSQARLQRLGCQLGSDTSKPFMNEEDSSVNIISDEDPDGDYHVSARNEELQNNASLKKRLRVHSLPSEDVRLGSMPKRWRIGELATKPEKPVVPEGPAPRSENNSKEFEATKEIFTKKGGHKFVADEYKRRQGKSSPIILSLDKVKGSEVGNSLPSTSIAAHAVDELIEAIDMEEKTDARENAGVHVNGLVDDTSKLPYIPPLPPPVAQISYKQYEGDDEDVDVEKVESEMADIDSDVDI